MPRTADPALETAWRSRLRQQPGSGLTIHQFCKREGISTASFHAWKRRLALRASLPAVPSGASTFVPVIVPPVREPQPSATTALVTIQLANGGLISLPVIAGVELVCEVAGTAARFSVTREGLPC